MASKIDRIAIVCFDHTMIRDLQRELAVNTARLEAGTNAAMASLGITFDDFTRLIGTVTRPVALPGNGIEVSPFYGHADLYGERAVDTSSGFVEALINEAIPEGGLYRSAPNRPLSSSIPRYLTVDKGCITVSTPTACPTETDGPVVIEEMGGARRYRKVTTYNAHTGGMTVRNGERATCGGVLVKDGTTEVGVFTLPDEVRSIRLATLARTIASVSCIFERIASGDIKDVSWEIEKESSKR